MFTAKKTFCKSWWYLVAMVLMTATSGCRSHAPLHTVDIEVKPAEGGIVRGIRDCYSDNTAVLEAMANEGYTFIGWNEGGKKLSSAKVLELDLPHSRSIVAEFALEGSSVVDLFEVIKVKNVEIRMISIDENIFDMGAQAEDPQAANYDPQATKYESPVHRVELAAYKLSQTPVTQALWVAVMGSNPSHFKGTTLPVESVSWDDIVNDFLPKLNALTGKQFRLPTEAEWEHAARGGGQAEGTALTDVAWFESNSGGRTHPVGQLQPNGLGLYDMYGNVWEWCADLYGRYGSEAQTNPTGSTSGSERVMRGGSWYNVAERCRASERDSYRSAHRFNDVGFRLAL